MSEWALRPIHRILVYTEHGLFPHLVERFFESCDGSVYDPFVGSGTVGVEALLRGRNFLGADSNPAAVVVAAAKTAPEMHVRLRPLPQATKYYRPEVYAALVKLARRVSTALEAAVFFAVARRFSVFRYSPAPKLREAPSGDVEGEYRRALARARRDVRLLRGARGDVVLADSTTWVPRRIECLLTSPPFANNVDYARHTMLELLWLGVPPGRARDLQIPACEAAARAWKPAYPVDLPIGGSRARGYKRFLGQYLYHMRRHIELIAEVLEGEAWYTIGDSYLGGAYVPTHQYLARFAQEAGLKARVEIVAMRTARTKLYLLKLGKPR